MKLENSECIINNSDCFFGRVFECYLNPNEPVFENDDCDVVNLCAFHYDEDVHIGLEGMCKKYPIFLEQVLESNNLKLIGKISQLSMDL